MKLQKPGAGLPDLERLTIKNLFVPILRIFFTWKIAIFLLKRETKIIEKLVSKLNQELCTKQVLIDRTFAIEDDTRAFSINIVLEHLTIANSLVMKVIQNLSAEKNIDQEIRIEDVKPKENKQGQIDEFLAFQTSYFHFIDNLPKVQSKSTKKHPWFIEFNNFDWSIFIYMHTFIHRRQIEAIIKKLGEENVN